MTWYCFRNSTGTSGNISIGPGLVLGIFIVVNNNKMYFLAIFCQFLSFYEVTVADEMTAIVFTYPGREAGCDLAITYHIPALILAR